MKVPHYLTVPVGHKTEETTGVTNDVGEIYSGTGPEDAMGRVAQPVVDYFDGHL